MPYQSRDVPLSGAGWNICCIRVAPGQKMRRIDVKGKISDVMILDREKPCLKMIWLIFQDLATLKCHSWIWRKVRFSAPGRFRWISCQDLLQKKPSEVHPSAKILILGSFPSHMVHKNNQPSPHIYGGSWDMSPHPSLVVNETNDQRGSTYRLRLRSACSVANKRLSVEFDARCKGPPGQQGAEDPTQRGLPTFFRYQHWHLSVGVFLFSLSLRGLLMEGRNLAKQLIDIHRSSWKSHSIYRSFCQSVLVFFSVGCDLPSTSEGATTKIQEKRWIHSCEVWNITELGIYCWGKERFLAVFCLLLGWWQWWCFFLGVGGRYDGDGDTDAFAAGEGDGNDKVIIKNISWSWSWWTATGFGPPKKTASSWFMSFWYHCCCNLPPLGVLTSSTKRSLSTPGRLLQLHAWLPVAEIPFGQSVEDRRFERVRKFILQVMHVECFDWCMSRAFSPVFVDELDFFFGQCSTSWACGTIVEWMGWLHINSYYVHVSYWTTPSRPLTL